MERGPRTDEFIIVVVCFCFDASMGIKFEVGTFFSVESDAIKFRIGRRFIFHTFGFIGAGECIGFGKLSGGLLVIIAAGETADRKSEECNRAKSWNEIDKFFHELTSCPKRQLRRPG